MSIEELSPYSTPERVKVRAFRLTSSKGIVCEISEWGATILKLIVPDRRGKFRDVVLGFDTPQRYWLPHPYFGGVVGRYANRISRGHFLLEGKDYTLACNDSPNHLHGGTRGFDRRIWRACPLTGKKIPALVLTLTSPHGEEGYPGQLTVRVVYALFGSHGLAVSYVAMADQPTIINLTQHSYFNLSGNQASTVLDHVLHVNADYFLPVDETLIPTGEFRHVRGTPFDFRAPRTIQERIDDHDEQLQRTGGYDHCFVINHVGEKKYVPAVRVYGPENGIVMTVMTTEPGVQVYSGNSLDGSLNGKNRCVYPRRSGLCLETQHFPDSPNQPTFPTTIIQPGIPYMSSTLFIFSTHQTIHDNSHWRGNALL